MSLTDQTCEACESMPASIVEPCDDASAPYSVCQSCHERLLALALRPVEWYNLAKRHGWPKYLLHDDFYDDDGVAMQPEEEVVDAESFPAPSLAEVSNDPEALLDFSIAHWSIDEATKDAWRSLPRGDVLRAISTRFAATRNLYIRDVCLEIAAVTQAENGAEFVRYCWGEYPSVNLSSLGEASAACLPFPDAFQRVTTALDSMPKTERRDSMLVLSYFHSEEVLDWIEREIFDPVTEGWGNLAAASNLDWPRIEKWLLAGRPLSLAAIDALRSIVRPMTPLLREHGPELRDRPDRDKFAATLNQCAKADPVPRVQQRIEYLLQNEQTFVRQD